MKVIIGLFTLILLSPVVHANESLNEGFLVGNQNPFRSIFHLPRHRPHTHLSSGEYSSSFQYEIHNSFTGSDAGTESIFIDGETYIGRITVERGFSNGWQAGIELPIISHQGGFFDSIIDDWHDFFSLDGFDRGDAIEDRLLYRYIDGNSTDISLSENSTDIGDVIITAGKRWESEAGSSLFRFELKLPTGDAENFTGSGGVDIGFRLQKTRKINLRSTLYGGVGVSWFGEGDILTELQKDWAGTFTFGWSWQRWSRIALKLQLDGQTAPYTDTEIFQLGDESIQVSIGGSVALSNNSVLDIVVVEDERQVNVSPDFGLLVRYRRH